MFKRNVGRWDRVVRLAVALAAFYPVFIDSSLVGSQITHWILLIFGMANIVAFFTGYCPVYHMTRINTARVSTET